MRFLACLVLIALGWHPAARAADPQVIVVASESNASYDEASAALLAELERNGTARSEVVLARVSDLAGLGNAKDGPPKLFIALGTEAARALGRRQDNVPVLNALVPADAYEQVQREGGRRSGSDTLVLYLDQPLGRQLDLVRLALPRARKVGALWSAEFQAWVTAADAAARNRGLQLISVQADAQLPLYSMLKLALDEADVLLALPDRQLYNSSTIQNVLLASFKARVPMLAFSPAYVRAGAMLALYSTPSQIGTQAGAMAAQVLQGKHIPPWVRYPTDYTVGVNLNVARSLGYSLDAASLTEALRRLERAR